MTSEDSEDDIRPCIKCEVCTYERDARWLCTVCHNKMCLQCKTTHHSIRTSISHKIIHIGTSSPVPQKNIFCPVHHKEIAKKYCMTCKMLICETCVDHQNHDGDTIKNVTDKYRNKLSQYITDMKYRLSDFQQILLSAQENEKSYSKQTINIVNSINRKRQEWKSQIDKMADNVIQQLQKLESDNLKIIRKQELEISKQINEIKDRLATCEEKLRLNKDIAVIKFVADIKPLKQQQTTLITPINLSPPKFTCSDVVKLPVDIGHLDIDTGEINNKATINDDEIASSTIDVTTVASFNTKNSSCISTVNVKQAWYGHGFGSGGNEVTLVNIDGSVEKKAKLDFELYGITVTKDGKLLLTLWHGHHVKKLSDDGLIMNIIDTSPYKTKGMCSTSENDVLVSVAKQTNQGKILRISTTGQLKQIIKPKKFHKSLLKAPRLVKENINHDICVIDGHSSLIVVNEDGELRFGYPDLSLSGNQISRCDGIVCDKFGFILLSDCYNHQIHQLDKDGHFIQYILTDEHGIEFPWGLSIDNKEQLWICNNNGSEITVIKFRS